MTLLLLVSELFLESHISLGGCLSFFHSSFHILYEFGKLAVLFVFLLETDRYFLVFYLHLSDHGITLLEFLFYNLELLRVSKCIFRADDFLELVAQTSALFHVKLDFDFDLLLACASDVALETFDLIDSLLIVSL